MKNYIPVDFPQVSILCHLNNSEHLFTLVRLLEKLIVRCPNTAQCEVTLQRGDLEDHLKYRSVITPLSQENDRVIILIINYDYLHSILLYE